MDSAKQAAAHLLGESYLTPDNWQDEKRFWQESILLCRHELLAWNR